MGVIRVHLDPLADVNRPAVLNVDLPRYTRPGTNPIATALATTL